MIKQWLLRILAGVFAWTIPACGRINVLGRDVPDSEYIRLYDADMAREKAGLKQEAGHDEHGRVPSWDQAWCEVGPTRMEPPTAQSFRMRRYIVTHRRALGLPELSCAKAWGLGPP